MEKLFSTEDVHRRERFSYWHEVACETLVPHEATPNDEASFAAMLCAGRIGDLELISFENTAMSVARTRLNCSRHDNDDLFFCQQLSGNLEIRQAGRAAVLAKGDMVLIDPLLPYSGNFGSGSKLLVLKLGREDLRARIGSTDAFLGLSSSAGSGGSEEQLAEFMATLPRWAGNISASTGEIMQTFCLDLVANAVGNFAGSNRANVSATRASTLMAVRMATERRLRDPELTPAKIAASLGITVRYANLLLSAEGTSLSRLVLSRRLERCRSALDDPSQASRTLSEIAYGWGFSDMTHFSRTFKAAFGMVPSAYRRMAAANSFQETDPR